MYRRQSGVDLELILVAALSGLSHFVILCSFVRPDAQGQLCGTLAENVLAETRTTVSQSFL
jgi:hypothetical protein